MTRLMPFVLICVVLLTGCATSAFVSQAQQEFAEVARLQRQASAELDRQCQAQPESCKPLVNLDFKKGPDDPTAWGTKMRPGGYRAWFDKAYGDRLKALTIKWTGFEYYVEAARAITDQMDAGTLEPHDGTRLIYGQRD